MAGWLQKVLPPNAQQKKSGALTLRGNSLASWSSPPPQGPQTLPNATIIYGIGASLLLVADFFLLLAGRWVAAAAVFALAGCLAGFALHLLKHQD